jgi:putative transposase
LELKRQRRKDWLNVLIGLKTRGVEDVLIASIDGLKGFVEAIEVAFPRTVIQHCIIHQIRSSTRYVNYKEPRPISADLKLIYQAPTEKDALVHLEEFENKWKSKYPQSVKSWRVCWDELSTMFKYPPLIRKLMYTTNAIENFNRQIRKVTKT